MENMIAKLKRMFARFIAAGPTNKATLLVGLIVLAIIVSMYSRMKRKQTEQKVGWRVEQKTKEKVKDTPPPLVRDNILASDNPYEQCKATALPSFINVSLVWHGSSFGKAFKSLSPPSIIVTAAGNDYPDPIRPEKVQTSKEGAIVVGSMAPDGSRSNFSNTHKEVHISAPSDYYITSASDKKGTYTKFSGTSGATPLVTGSLSGFEWLAGYHPTAEEAKLLLAKTAIPTLSSNENPRTSGVGMVNAYKLGMVGKRLKATCGSNISCFKEMIRKAALLNPSNKELWRSVACIYDSSDFTENAKGAMSIYKAIIGDIDRRIYASCKVDTDCTHVPSCSYFRRTGNIVLLPANKDYIAECQGTVLCNGKCRCDGTKVTDMPTDYKNIFSTRQALCVNSKCISKYSVAYKRQPASEQNSSAGGSGSVQ